MSTSNFCVPRDMDVDKLSILPLNDQIVAADQRTNFIDATPRQVALTTLKQQLVQCDWTPVDLALTSASNQAAVAMRAPHWRASIQSC